MEAQPSRLRHRTRLPSVTRRKNSPSRKCTTKDLHLPTLSTKRSASPYSSTLLQISRSRSKTKNTIQGHQRLLNSKFFTKLIKISGASASTADTGVDDSENPIIEPESPKITDLNPSINAKHFNHKIEFGIQHYLDSDMTSELRCDPKSLFRESIEIKRGRIIQLEYNDVVIEDPHLQPLDSESPKFSRRGGVSSPFDLDETRNNSRWNSPIPPRPETRNTYVKPPNYCRHFRSNSNFIS